jgi:hypothetical protein
MWDRGDKAPRKVLNGTGETETARVLKQVDKEDLGREMRLGATRVDINSQGAP